MGVSLRLHEIYRIVDNSFLKKRESFDILIRKIEVYFLILELRRYLKIPKEVKIDIFFNLPDTDKYKDSPDNLKTTLAFCRPGAKDDDGEVRNFEIYFNEMLFVDNEIKRDFRFRPACHEMIHVLQFVHGNLSYAFLDVMIDSELVKNKTVPLWKGKVYYNWLMESSELPWEREAYANDSKLAKTFLKDYFNENAGMIQLLIVGFKYWKRSFSKIYR